VRFEAVTPCVFGRPFALSRYCRAGHRFDVDVTGTKACKATAVEPSPSACVGSVARWLPAVLYEDRSWADSTLRDEYMGISAVDGVPVDVWGWNHTNPGCPGEHDSEHRVYISRATQMPLMETQTGRTACASYPWRATVTFEALEDIGGSFWYMASKFGGNMFAMPKGCENATAPVVAA